MKTIKFLSGITRSLLIAFVAMVVIAGSVENMLAADGALDPTFAGTGKTLTLFQYGMSIGSSVVVQPDGKAVVSGLVADQTFAPAWGVARYNVDGTLDTTFGTGGKVTIDFLSYYSWKVDVKLQPDGKIVLAGAVAPSGSYDDFGIVRLNPNGSLDQSFGTGGKVTCDFFGFGDGAMGVAIQPDGKIVAAGYATNQGGTFDFGAIRVDANGALDNSFGTGGKVIIDFFGQPDIGADVAIQADGKIVMVGTARIQGFVADFTTIRLDSNGTLDPTFGTGGKSFVSFFDYDEANAVAIQADGRIVVGGYTRGDYPTSQDFALTRLQTDGTIDTTFGNNGRVLTDFFLGFDHIYDLVIQPDGKIIAAGDVTADPADVELYVDYGIARYLSDGTLDTTFGIGGKVNTDFGDADYGQGIALGPDCKLVASGLSWQLTTGGDLSFGVARYESSGCPVEPPTPTGNTCPRTHGYWKNHGDAWPVNSLLLGTQTYSKSELLALLGTTSQTDASITLARQLIAAKLNIANGSDAAPITATIAEADALLATFSGKLPYKVKSSSTSGQAMTALATTLTNYNTGLMTPTCQP